MEQRIYFDNSATTPLDPRVREAMKPYFGEVFGNPSSLHWAGRRAHEALDIARRQVADLLSASADEIAFTASGLDQASPVRAYLYIFRNRDAYDRNLDDVDACARSYVTDPATYEKIEISPYVATGQGPWAPDFKAALTDALTVAAGTGG